MSVTHSTIVLRQFILTFEDRISPLVVAWTYVPTRCGSSCGLKVLILLSPGLSNTSPLCAVLSPIFLNSLSNGKERTVARDRHFSRGRRKGMTLMV